MFDDSNENPPPSLLANQALGSVTCVNGRAGEYPCLNVDLMAFLPKDQMGGGSANTNDIWGWTDPVSGKEIAIVGRTNGTSFVEVSSASSPRYLGFLPSHDNGVDSWRDIKVYKDHAFIVADGSGNRTHGLQVFDLTQLRNISNPPPTFSETAHLGTFGNAHNLVINEDTGYAYAVRSNRCSGGLYMVDISLPTAPRYAGCFSSDGKTHDAQCVVYAGPDTRYRGREICFAYNEDTLTIVDVNDKTSPVQLSRTAYDGASYTHQGWLTDDHRYALMDDESDERRYGINTTTYIWDAADLRNPVVIGTYVSSAPAIDHNLYVRGHYVYESNYRAGLRILDASSVASGKLSEVAYFDTIPNSDRAQFSGSWSNYPYFASGHVILTDIGYGLFVVKPTKLAGPRN